MQLSLRELTRRFDDKVAVDAVSIDMTPGIYGLLGPNGAGKTTLMRMICDVLRPTSGRIGFDGTDIRDLGGDYRALLGYLPQDFGYYPEFTAMEFLLYLASLKGVDRHKARALCSRLIETVGLDTVADERIRTFSGGMKQRLGIAQAMISDPRILVLDEPTAGLDPKERVRFRNLISSLSQGRIVILSTHIVSDVEHIADELVVMKKGRFLLQGRTDALTAHAEGKVWECTVPAEEADRLTDLLTVSNVRYRPDGPAIVRLVADTRPMADAQPVEPTLEDLFLYLFRDEDLAAGDTGTAVESGRGSGRRHHHA